GGQLGGDGLEGVVYLVEGRVEPRDRKIAGEHRARDTETLKAVENHLAKTVERPVMIIGHEIGNLDRHIWPPPEKGEALAPTPHAQDIAVDRAAAMVENKDLVRKVPRESLRPGKLVGKDHQIEDETVRLQPGKAGAPLRIIHEIATRGETARRILAP